MGKMPTGGNMDRQSGFREYGIKTYQFEYIGDRKKIDGKINGSKSI